MSADNPMISVLMSVYNGSKYLREAIESILNQTFEDFEFIIINDGSTDKSEEIIHSFSDTRIRYLRNDKNIGLTESLNKGISVAKGKYIARMDADDISLPTRLEEQFNFMEAHPEYTFSGTCATRIDGQNRDINPWILSAEYWKILGNIFLKNYFIHSSVIILKEKILAIGGYDEEFIYAQDYRLWLCLIANGYKGLNLSKPLITFRVTDDSISVIYKIRQDNYACKAIQKTINDVFKVKVSISVLKAIRSSIIHWKRVHYLVATRSLFILRRIYLAFQLKYPNELKAQKLFRSHINRFIDINFSEKLQTPFKKALFARTNFNKVSNRDLKI